MSTISFIVATTCRETLPATLASIECAAGDEIILVSDVALNLHMQEFVMSNPHIRCMSHPAGNNWGHTERNWAMQYAKGDYIAHLDDDDTYVVGHREIMARAIRQHPGQPLVFRMQYPNGQILWRSKTIECGNVGTPMPLLPNGPIRGEFGPFNGGDLFYLESYAIGHNIAAEHLVWCEDVTVLIRPHTSA